MKLFLQCCDFIEAKFIRIFQEKITEIDDGLDAKIKTVKLNLDSVKNGINDQIGKEHVSNNINDGDYNDGVALKHLLNNLRKK